MTGIEDEQRHREVVPVGDLLDDVLAKLGGASRFSLLEIMEHWEDIVGSRWKSATRPVKVAGQTLIVEVIDGAAASLLRFELPHLKRRLSELVSETGALEVRLRVVDHPWITDSSDQVFP